MKLNRPALRDWVHQQFIAEREALDSAGIARILEAGRQWNLVPTLNAGGAAVFAHAGLPAYGHQIAAAVHVCLDSGADQVLVIGVLHASD